MNRALKSLGALPLCAACWMLWWSQTAAAQQLRTREGFWAAFGLGYGANSMSCGASCSVNPDVKGGSATASLKLGGTPSSRLRLGGEINVWIKDLSGGVTESVGNVSGAAYFYPSLRSGFFMKGGVGVASVEFSQGNSNASQGGVGFLAGLGYDLPVSRKVSLTPVTNFYFGHEGNLQHAIIDFGLSVQYN